MLKFTNIYWGAVLLAIVVITSLIYSESYFFPERVAAQERQQLEFQQQYWQEWVNKLPEAMIYFRDDRTQLCFGYIRGGSHQGGPAMAMVDCNTVPSELLIKPQN